MDQINFPQHKITRRKAGLMLLSSVALSACMPTVETRPQITATGGKIRLGVDSLDIITDYVSPQKSPYIDHKITPSPAVQLSQWATQTLKPADDQGNALLTIMKASMTEKEIEAEEGLKALFTNQQRLLVNVDLEGILSFHHPDGRKSATLTIVASSEKSIADNTTPAEADQIRFQAIREAVGRFDQELRRQLSGFDGAWPLA